MACSSPMLLITVATRVFFLSLRRCMSSLAQMAMMWSPSTMVPCSSQTISRSPSPSRARPMSAPSCCTRAAITSGCSAPQLALILVPSGSQPMQVTRAPSSANTCGATL